MRVVTTELDEDTNKEQEKEILSCVMVFRFWVVGFAAGWDRMTMQPQGEYFGAPLISITFRS